MNVKMEFARFLAEMESLWVKRLVMTKIKYQEMDVHPSV